MDKRERIIKYITQVKAMANQLGRNGEELPANRVVEKILWSLTNDFENIVCAIKESKDLSMLSVKEILESLEACKQLRRTDYEPFDQAL